MKKVISISIISCLLFFSCETTKQENNLPDNSQVELAQPQSETSEDIASEDTTSEDIQSEDAASEIETISQEEDESDNTTLESENNIEETAFEEKIEDQSEYNFEELIPDEEIEKDLSEKNENKIDSDKQQNINVQKTEQVQSSVSKIAAADTKASSENTTSEKKETAAAEESTEKKSLQQELSEASETISEEPKQPVPSRSMQIKNHQFIDVAYPGAGWIYLGEVEKQNLFVFFGRKIENGETIFTLQPKKSGEATLHFYKNDPLSQNYIDDYMTVSVSTESATDTIHEKAPLYASVVPPKPQKIKPITEKDAGEEIPSENKTTETNNKTNKTTSVSENSPSEDNSNIQTRISKNDNTVEKIPDFSSKSSQTEQLEEPANPVSSDLLQAAQKAYNEKKYPEALQLIKDFFLSTSNRIDEGLYLEAQILEAKSPVQNIKNAISDYDTIVDKWPASKFWKKANERSIYLKRFYIDIR